MTKSQSQVLKFSLVGIAVLVCGVATAYTLTIPPGPITGTVRICYNTKNGKPRLVSPLTVCKTSETRFEFVATPREVFVPADGTPAENGAALLAAAGAITGDLERPTTLRLDDGTYNVGSTTLDLSGTVLQGRSTDNTIVTGSGSSTFSIGAGGTVRTDSDVNTLTINNTGGNTYAVGLVFVGASGRITDVNVNVSGGTNGYGLVNALGDVIVRGARVSTNASSESVAYVHDLGGLGARSRVSASKLFGVSGAIGQGEAIRSSQGAELRLSNSVAEGTTYYANVQAGSGDATLRGNALSGAAAGLVVCRATSTMSSFFPTTCPSESWSTAAD